MTTCSHSTTSTKASCIEGLQQVAPGSVDLVFADPPFNIGYEYDVYHDQRAAEEYLDWTRKWIGGVKRVLKPNGTFWLAIGDEYAAELKLIAQARIRLRLPELGDLVLHLRRELRPRIQPLAHAPVPLRLRPAGFHLQRRQSGRAGALGTAVGLCRHAGEPQRPPARQHLDPASARPAQRLSPRSRHLALSPRGGHVQGARRVPRLPDAGAVAGPDHPLQFESAGRRARSVRRQRHDVQRGEEAGAAVAGLRAFEGLRPADLRPA